MVFFQKLFKYFNGTAFSTVLVSPSAIVFPVILALRFVD